MEKIVTKYNLTGECEISVAETIKSWDKDWSISQWNEEYTLCHDNEKSENFTKTDLKVRISESQSKELIIWLKLIPIDYSFFRSGRTWRRIEDLR